MNIIMASVARETKKKDQIENNIVISGIPISENDEEEDSKKEDEEKVKAILDIIQIDAASIKSQSRIKKKENN
jgi:NAD(P)H-dependent FMN reductase